MIEINILNHLNTNCQFGSRFHIVQKEKDKGKLQPYIDLIEYDKQYQNQSINRKFKDIMFNLLDALETVCFHQIQSVKQMNNLYIPTVFQLYFQIDQITIENIVMPSKILTKDKLILNPMFCDFSTFSQNIQRKVDQIKDIDADEFYVIMLLWKLRQLLNDHQKANNIQFEIILLPKYCNFCILKIDQGQEQIYFISESHRQAFLKQNSKYNQNSVLIYQSLSNKKITELEIKLFQVAQSDLAIRNGKQINKMIQKNEKIRQMLDQDMINQLEEKFGIKNQNYFQIFYKNCIQAQSQLCFNGDINDYLKHTIKFYQDKNPKCECGNEFDKYYYDTFMIDSDFYDIIDQIILELIEDQNLDYTLYLIQLYLEIEIDIFGNQFVILFFKDKYNDKFPLKKVLSKVKNYNYQLNFIDENDKIEQDLFEGIDEVDYPMTFENQIIEEINQDYLSPKMNTQDKQKQFSLN